MIYRIFLLSFLFLNSIALSGQKLVCDNALFVKLKTDAVSLTDSTQFGLISLNNKNRAVSFERLFPDAGTFEKKHRKYDLHLWYTVTFAGKPNIALLLQQYKKHQSVDFVEPVYDITMLAGKAVNEHKATDEAQTDYTNKQWYLGNDTKDKKNIDLGVYDAWKYVDNASGVIVALISSGVDHKHEEFYNCLVVKDTANNPLFKDKNATGIAGIIAAEKGNTGIAGIASGTSGKGVKILVYDADVKRIPLQFVSAADNGAVICQADWHYTRPGVYNVALHEAVKYFYENAGGDENGNPARGVLMSGGLILVPAGDLNSSNVYFPQTFDETLTVGAVNFSGKKARYSNHGKNAEILAPGGDLDAGKQYMIFTAYNNNRYGYIMGTSAACAQVTGVAALALKKHGSAMYSPEMLKCRLLRTADKTDSGVGIVNASKVINEVIAKAEGISFAKTSIKLRAGESVKLNPQILPTDACLGRIVWASSNPQIVAVGSSGIVRALKEGNADITANIADGGGKAVCGITVESVASKPATGISITPVTKNINVNEEFKLVATIEPADASDKRIVWKSSNDVAVSVSDGKIKGLQCGGSSTITAETANGKFVASSIISVGEKLKTLSLSSSVENIQLNEIKQLTVSKNPVGACNASIKWISENPEIVSIDSLGKIKGISCGSTTVKAVSETGITDNCVVSVGRPVKGIEISLKKLNMIIGEEQKLDAKILPADACNKGVKWKSSNAEVVTVEEGGRISAKNCGKAVVTSYSEEGNFSATCDIEVGKPVSGLKLSDNKINIIPTQEVVLSASVLPDIACDKRLEWTSNNPAVVTVNANGKVKGISCGAGVITVKSLAGNFSASCEVNVGEKVSGVSLLPTSLQMWVNEVQKVNYTIMPADACNKKVMWKTDNPSVATVNNGMVKAVNCGEATISVITDDGAFSVTCKVKVGEDLTGISLSASTINLRIGNLHKLNCTPIPANVCDKKMLWISTNPSVATVTQSGQIKAVSCGTTTVKVTCEGFDTECKVDVGKQITGVTLSKTLSKLTKGQSITLQLALTPADACVKPTSWSSSNPAAVTVDNTGKVTAINKGSSVITVTVEGGFTAVCEVDVDL